MAIQFNGGQTLSSLSGGKWTVMAWFNPTSTSDFRPWFELSATNSDYHWLGIWDGDGYSETQGGGGYSFTAPSGWAHIAIVVDPDVDEIRVYVNGSLDHTLDYDLTVNAIRVASDSYASTFAGYGSALKIWDRALSAAEIASEMATVEPQTTPYAAQAWESVHDGSLVRLDPWGSASWSGFIGTEANAQAPVVRGLAGMPPALRYGTTGGTTQALVSSVEVSATATATTVTRVALASSVSGSATTTAGLATGVRLASTPTVTATATASLSSAVRLASTAGATATATGTLATTIRLASSGTVSAAATAPLATRVALSTAVTGTATATTALTVLSVTVVRYRWRLDDGDEDEATWAVSENAALTGPLGTRRLRVQVQTAGDAPSSAYTLQYRLNSGAWTTVP